MKEKVFIGWVAYTVGLIASAIVKPDWLVVIIMSLVFLVVYSMIDYFDNKFAKRSNRE